MKFEALLGLVLAAGSAVRGDPVMIDPAASRVVIAVKSTMDSFTATVPKFTAAVTVAPETGQVQTAVFSCSFATLKTGKSGRDADMNAWQQTGRYPDVVFTLRTLESAAPGSCVARGWLRFHGVEREVSIPVVIRGPRPAFLCDGEVAIDTRDYGLPVIKKFVLLKVDPVVHVSFHLQGRLAAP